MLMSIKCKTSLLDSIRRNLSVIQKEPGKWPLLLLILLLTMVGGPAFSQVGDGEITVKGVIVDSNGTRLTGVTVEAKGTKKSTTTNNNGEFELKGVKKNATLTLSMVGF